MDVYKVFWIGARGRRHNLPGVVVGLFEQDAVERALCAVDMPDDGTFQAELSRDLAGFNLACNDLRRANLANANLCRANLSCCDLRGGNLSGANLSGTNLSCCDLRGADFTGANLSGTNLLSCDVRGADFTGANLSGADMAGVYR
jgi:uncharacterized protein YjbI with pentapeptide repeats